MAEVELSPQFGAELKDGFKPINAWISGSILWLDEIQQFYRERSAIEKEYSIKLRDLAKKYFEKKAKRSSQLSVGETPTVTPGSLESASMTTWTVQLQTLEVRANEHMKYSGEITIHQAEPLKQLQARLEEVRKAHVEQASKLEKERDTSYADLKRIKGKYDSVCQEHENRRKKVDSPLSRSNAQVALQVHQADMHNAKNTYLIAINVTNKQKERYYNHYLPDLLDSLQDLSEYRIAQLNSIWSRAAAVELGTLTRSTEAIKHLASEIPRNNPLLDSMMFLRHNIPNWQEPSNFSFEPSPVWLDDDSMAATEPAKNFLRNIQMKSKEQLRELRPEVERKRREMDNAKKLQLAIRAGKDKRDELDAIKDHFQLQEQLHETERRKIGAEVEFACIATAVGDLSVGAKNHAFKAQTFKIPTNCDLCGERIWGLSAKGFVCSDCGFTCHSKCELKVPADCPGEQDKDERRRLKVIRQEEAHTLQPEAEVSSPSTSLAPTLTRSDTANSMNTLSSGYATNAKRSISGSTLPTATPEAGIDDTTSSPAAAKPAPGPRRNRIVAPPPAAYIKSPPADSTETTTSNGAPRSSEKRAKMIYPYDATGDGEISVDEGREVVIVEPDDGSGWLKVRAGHMTGLVPAAYTEALPAASHSHSLSSSTIAERPSSTYSASSASLAGSTTGTMAKKVGPAVNPKRGAKKLKHVEALYPYEARSSGEHSMREGERFVLVQKDGGDGWCEVEKSGVVASVPAAYVKEV